MFPATLQPQARGLLQNRVVLWKEQAEASRAPSRAHSPGLLGPPYPSGRLTPTRLDMVRPWVLPPPLAPPPPFAPPGVPLAGPWGLRPSAWSLPPPQGPWPSSAPPWWLARRPPNPYADAWDWGWGLD